MNDVVSKLALPARWLVVAGIAYTLATTVLYFLSPPTTTPSTPAATSTTAAPRPAPDVNAILARNLFGAADVNATPVEIDQPAVVTRLPLELLGVFVADAADSSAAIISQRGRPGILYSIGEDVPGGATLLEVLPDHVVLRRAGVRETLPFPAAGESLAARSRIEPDPGFQEVPIETYEEVYDADYDEPPDDGSEPDLDSTSVRELVDEYRDELENDPSQALEDLGVTAVSSGAAEGYRVGNLAQSPYLSQTGLQPGDVILSVNGRPVGDLNQDRLELDNVLAQGSARLEVQRGTRRFFVTASLQ
ncbi:MAG: type II secretion system protein N [Pseudomonadales bacterium]